MEYLKRSISGRKDPVILSNTKICNSSGSSYLTEALFFDRIYKIYRMNTKNIIKSFLSGKSKIIS